MIGAKLKAAREFAGLNQVDVADFLGLRQSSYSQIEAGRNSLRVEHLIKLSKLLDRPVNYFLGLSDQPSLSPDESELLHLYRALPPGLDQYALAALRAWAGLRSELRPEPVKEPGQEAAAPPTISEEKLAEWREDIEVIDLYLAVHAAAPEQRKQVILYLLDRLERKERLEAKAAEEPRAATATE